MRYMGTHPWYDLFCDFMVKGNNVNDNGLAIDLMCYECMFCIVLTCRVQGLCDSRVCDASMTQYIAWRKPYFQTMIRWHVPINWIAAKYVLIGYIDPGCWEGWMCSTLCFYDTRGHGREVLRHAPHVVVMTTVGYPRSWEGCAKTSSPCCCDDDGRMPTRRG